jgi:tRNA (adenine57-N1/adenine58-N1)-methyltransferase
VPLAEGDLVVVWIDPRRVYLVKLERGKRLDTDKGSLLHEDIIGKEYGESLAIQRGKAHLLYPTLDYIYEGLHRPSQVLYPKDIGYMIYVSGIKPGSTVVEAGTGSGFLTISLANFVGNEGRVVTYDVREDMQNRARKNARLLGLEDRVTFKLGDVRQGIEEKDVDAVFLDMPDPWLVVQHAWSSLRPSGTLEVFIPTTNQLERVFLTMIQNNFVDVKAVEIIMREFQVKENATRPRTIGVTHTGYIVSGRKSIKGS